MFQIANTKALKVVAEISEAYIATVDKSDSVEISFPSTNIRYTSTLDVVSRVINPSNRTFTVEIYIPDLDGNIVPNMVAKLKLNDVTENGALIISPNLLNEHEGEQFVYVAQQEGTHWVARKRMVQTGNSFNNSIIVEEGLLPGEYLITKGHTNVADGSTLSIINL